MEVITTHINADFDTIASMLAAHKLYPDAVLVMPGSQEETVKGFLVQSAFYTLAMRKVKDVDLDRVKRLVLVDIRNSARIGPFRELVGKPGVEIHVYDHHPDAEADVHGDLEVVRCVGSTTTILVGILEERGIGVTPDEATVMMLGIYEDTGSLSFPSTTVSDYHAAAWLLARGANLSSVTDILAREMTSDQVALLYDLLQGSRPYVIHGVEVVIAEARRDDYVGDVAMLVHKLRDMESATVLFAVCQLGDRVVAVGRSRREEVDAGAVMRELGGGGHPYAASATIRDATTFQVRDRILQVLAEKVIRRRTVADLMASPARHADVGDTVLDLHHLLTRYNLNAVPVLKEGRVAGVITRQVVEKALFHGLGGEQAGEYMNADFETVTPGDDIDRVQEIIIGRNQRLIPVVGDDGRPVGVVTRTALLRHMHSVSRFPRPGAEDAVPAGGTYARPKHARNLMRDRLPAPVMEMLASAGKVAERLGMKAYIVGGFVRDLIMRIDNFDIDIVIEGDGIAFAESFAKVHPCRVRAHRKFGTAVLVFPDGFKIDVATARVEYYVKPAALPTVEYSSMKQDLYRRDFTINTLAIRLNGDAFGELIDFFGGQRDIKDRSIRVLHSLSFVEDPTRILRACRFEQRFGFAIARHTMNLIRNAVRLSLIARLPRPRLYAELELILKEEDPAAIFRRLSEMKIGPSIHPKILLDGPQLDRMEEAAEVLVWFSLLFLDEPVEKWMVYFLALVDPLTTDEAKAFVAELGAERKIRALTHLCKEQGDPVIRELLGARAVSRKLIRDTLGPLPTEVILFLMARSRHPDIKRYISLYFTGIRKVRPLVNGDDLIALGYPPGPLFREILDAVLERKFAGELPTKAAEMSWILANVPKPPVPGRA